MNWFQALILGIVEGLTEYLPVSSTGHLILTGSLLGVENRVADNFSVAIQFGAIMAVLTLYWKYIQSMLLGLVGRNPEGLRLAIRIIVAFLPAAVIGILLKDKIEEYLFSPGPVVAALILGGIAMIVIEKRLPPPGSDAEEGLKELGAMSLRDALLIGLAQCLAMWPGTSRSMSTILGARLVGLKPAAAAEFSFLLALPTLGGATLLKMVKDREEFLNMDGGITMLLFGNVVAFIVAAVAVRWFVGFVTKRGMTPFGYYRIVLGVAFLILSMLGYVSME
ncbi:undecaprenyl-diphosphate phosphatase [bacterium]|nr:undecaprenyl-diphosphate phosphatase [bacterium]